MSLTYQPKYISRKKKHGFLTRMRTRNGRNIIKRRMHKKRRVLSV